MASHSASSYSQMPTVKRILHEPLVWFLLLGGLLFLCTQWLGGSVGPGSNRIVITRGLIDHLASGFVGTWQRPPTEVELKGLIDDYIKEEIAAREAAALGIDRDDTIIRRRLRQKLEFLFADETPATPITDAELSAWLNRHPDSFRVEPKVAFRQVAVRPDRHGSSLRADTEKLLAKLRAGGPDAAIEHMGDASMLPAEQPLEPLYDVARDFGEDFAKDLLKIEPGHWEGPIESPYGLHLVLVRERVAGAKPALQEIRPVNEREVQTERRKAQMQAMYDRLLDKYSVTIEKSAAAPAGNAKAAP